MAPNDTSARLAQSVERQALNLVVRGSSPRSGVLFCQTSGTEFAVIGGIVGVKGKDYIPVAT
jgi:hypothetical protein